MPRTSEHAGCRAEIGRLRVLGPYYAAVTVEPNGVDRLDRIERTFHEELVGPRKSPGKRNTSEDIDVVRTLARVVADRIDADPAFDPWARAVLRDLLKNAAHRCHGGS